MRHARPRIADAHLGRDVFVVLDIGADPDRDPRAVGPGELRPLDDGGIAEPVGIHCLISSLWHVECITRLTATQQPVILIRMADSIRFTLNGRAGRRRGRVADDDPARLAARSARPQGHQGRLRRGRLRRLHRRAGARRRPARGDEFLHRDAGPDGRPVDPHGRGLARQGRRAASGAARDGRGRRHAMRLLHAGLRDVGLRLCVGRRAGRSRDHPRCAGRQSLPLHRLSADRRGDDEDRGPRRRAAPRRRRRARSRPLSTASSSRRARSPS